MNNKYCMYCGRNINGDAVVCPYCGREQMMMDLQQGQWQEQQPTIHVGESIQNAVPMQYDLQKQSYDVGYNYVSPYSAQNSYVSPPQGGQGQFFQSSYDPYQGAVYENAYMPSNQVFGDQHFNQDYQANNNLSIDNESVAPTSFDNKKNISSNNVHEQGDTNFSSVQPVILRRVATAELYTIFLPVTIGKGSAADIHVVGNPTISRVHVRIMQQNGLYYIVDLHSSNGTYVNGLRIDPDCPTIINIGDAFYLSDELFSLESAVL